MEDGIEHETAIRSSGRRTPLVLAGLALVAVVAVVLVGGGGADDEAVPPAPTATSTRSTPTSETLTTTSPPPTLPIFGIASTERGLVPFAAPRPPVRGSPSARDDDLVPLGSPIATDGRIAVLAEDTSLHVGIPGGSFRRTGCCWSELVPSTEPGHVWGRMAGQLSLVDLDAADPPAAVSLEVLDADVLGPASFGVVSVDAAGVVRWHRPFFDPTPVPLPDDQEAVGAGGELVLVEGPVGSAGGRRLELWRVADGGFWQSFEVPAGVDRPAVLAPDGSHVAVPVEDGWSIRNATTAFEVGRLPDGSVPVWIGTRRFGQLDQGRIVVSDGTVIDPPWAVAAVALQAPVLVAPR